MIPALAAAARNSKNAAAWGDKPTDKTNNKKAEPRLNTFSQAASIRQRVLASTLKADTIQGIEVLDYLQHGSETTVEVTTPTNQRHTVKTTMIGTDRQQRLYFQLPPLPPYQLNRFFAEGYRLTIHLVCERGSGALVTFSGQIEHLMTSPLALFSVRLPPRIELYPLREETRYPVTLSGIAIGQRQQIEVQVRDLSLKGCSFSTSPLAPAFENEQKVVLRIEHTAANLRFSLSGVACNQRRMGNSCVYGMRFDEEGTCHSNDLFKWLEFNGREMVLRTPTPAA